MRRQACVSHHSPLWDTWCRIASSQLIANRKHSDHNDSEYDKVISDYRAMLGAAYSTLRARSLRHDGSKHT